MIYKQFHPLNLLNNHFRQMSADALSRLRTALALQASAAAADLAATLGVSVPTLYRLLQRLSPAGRMRSDGDVFSASAPGRATRPAVLPASRRSGA